MSRYYEFGDRVQSTHAMDMLDHCWGRYGTVIGYNLEDEKYNVLVQWDDGKTEFLSDKAEWLVWVGYDEPSEMLSIPHTDN